MALTLQIGAHKTASTHLQQTLRALTGAMVREGILYLDPVTLRRGSGRLDLSLDVIEALLDTYRALRKGGELFIDTLRRVGQDPFKAAANGARHPKAAEEAVA